MAASGSACRSDLQQIQLAVLNREFDVEHLLFQVLQLDHLLQQLVMNRRDSTPSSDPAAAASGARHDIFALGIRQPFSRHQPCHPSPGFA